MALSTEKDKERSNISEQNHNGAASDKNSAKEIISQKIRREMIAEAAYYRAEKRGFQQGDPVEDWLAAEEEIDEKLAEPTPRPSGIVLELENSW